MNVDIRVAGLAVVLALVAAVAGLGLAASDAQAAAPTDGEALPAICKAGPISFDCTYY
jgi:hypothetical protein